MDSETKITRIIEYLQNSSKQLYAYVCECARKKCSFLFDIRDLMKFDPELVDALIEEHDDTLKAWRSAILEITGETNDNEVYIQFRNLPQTQKRKIRHLRSGDLGQFVSIEAVIRNKGPILPRVTSLRFECPSCGNLIPVLQQDQKMKEPTRCGCGRKGKFRVVNTERVDQQRMVLAEPNDDTGEGEQPATINVILKGPHLVSPFNKMKTNPGARIIMNGTLEEMPRILKTGGQSTTMDVVFNCNYYEPAEEEVEDTEITKEEKKEIQSIPQHEDWLSKLSDSFAPGIYGMDTIKEAILLQMVGGVRWKNDNDSPERGDIHVLLVGDPGSAKSKFLKRATSLCPGARFISGKGATAAGLTASAVKDEFLGGWTLEAGAMVLAHKRLFCLDELDKLNKDDTNALHEALEGQTVTVAKANVQATLQCQAPLLSAANPKFQRFDRYAKSLADQIDLPATLINRFDLVFPIVDVPNTQEDRNSARFMLTTLNVEPEAPISSKMVKKYIMYCKQFEPVLSEDAIKVIEDFFVELRNPNSQHYVKEDPPKNGDAQELPITKRQLGSARRCAEAYAKLRQSNTVCKEDAERAVNMVKTYLDAVAKDMETGKYDIDKLEGAPAKERNKHSKIQRIIKEMGDKGPMAIEVIKEEVEKQGYTEEDMDKDIKKLKKSGDVVEPEPGKIQTI